MSVKKINILDNIKTLNILFVVDENYICKRFNKVKAILEKSSNKMVSISNYTEAYNFFLKNKEKIDIVLLLSNIQNIKAFSFISHMKKVSLDMPFLIIGEKSDKHFESINYIQKPVNFKELIEKIHFLCNIDYFAIDNLITQIDNEFAQEDNILRLSEDDLVDMTALIDDYETIIAEMLYNEEREKTVNAKDIHMLLQKTYNTFYTFIDEDIKDAIEPFSLILISFANTITNVSFRKDTSNDIYEVIMLLLEDILSFIETSIHSKCYIHSQYLLDSFISNIEYLKVKCGLTKEVEDEEQLEFF
jgi:hypothetical protein